MNIAIENDAYLRGYEAREKGLPSSSNSESTDPDRRAWNAGWEAKNEEAEAIKKFNR